jgi:hypothetical protein
MTASDPRQTTPGARPEGDKQRQAAATSEAQDRSGRRPEYVIEIWASPQLRSKDPGRPLSLAEALQAGRQPAAGRDREPDPEPEIEP